MNFQEHQIYHIYNTGNNNQPVFFNKENYRHFLKKIKTHLLPFCDVLSYSLVPNQFNIEVHVKPFEEQNYRQSDTKELSGAVSKTVFHSERHPLAVNIGIMLSSYTQAINKQNKTSGSLFRQKTKATQIDSFSEATTCFHYLHQKAWIERLVNKNEDWEFSSFREYLGLVENLVCNQELTFKMLNLDRRKIYDETYLRLDPQSIRNIF